MSHYPQKNAGWGAPIAGVNIRRTGKPNGQNWAPITEGGYLMHFGIKGQKWGIRRYQNEDGSLTEEGKKRYNEGTESAEWKKSEAKRLSDDELRRRNARLQAEQQYKNLTTTDAERERQQFRKDLLKKALIIPVVAVAGVVGKKLISSHADQIANVFSKYAKTAISRIKSPIAKQLSSRKIASQTIDKTVQNAANRYSGLNRPPLGMREWGPMSMVEILKKR